MTDRPPLRVVVDALGALVTAGEIPPLTPWQIEVIAWAFGPEHPAPTRRPVTGRPSERVGLPSYPSPRSVSESLATHDDDESDDDERHPLVRLNDTVDTVGR
jgi:hypothetical protein